MSNPFQTSSNPFEDDFDYNRPSRSRSEEENMSAEERIQRIMQEIEDSEDRQLDSTRRALASIDDSERTGIATAEELLHQREQLTNIERKTGQINKDLKTSQKHITGIKSVFGGLKNWWYGDKDKEQSSRNPESGGSKLQDTVEKHNASRPHPGERLRSDDGRGFYEEEDLDREFMKISRGPTQQYFKPVTHSKKEDALNENLDLMSHGMSRLKGLAIGLGDEIQSQNEQLDRINTSVDRADIKLNDQNRQMRNILKK